MRFLPTQDLALHLTEDLIFFRVVLGLFCHILYKRPAYSMYVTYVCTYYMCPPSLRRGDPASLSLSIIKILYPASARKLLELLKAGPKSKSFRSRCKERGAGSLFSQSVQVYTSYICCPLRSYRSVKKCIQLYWPRVWPRQCMESGAKSTPRSQILPTHVRRPYSIFCSIE